MADVVSMPKLGFDMAEGTLVRWVASEGSPIDKGAVLAEIETDKATVEVESTYSGVIGLHLVKEGAIVPVNTPIAVIVQPGEAVDLKALGLEQAEATATLPAEKISPTPQDVHPVVTPVEEAVVEDTQLPGGVRASPLARKLATDLGVDLHKVRGSGPGGRIIKVDIENYKETVVAVVQPAAEVNAAGLPVTAIVPPLVYEKRPDTMASVSRLRSAISRRMTESKQQIPHFYVTREFKMDALMNLRKQINAVLPEEEKISVNDFLVKGVGLALREFANLNASVNPQKNEIIQHGAINLGVAVAVAGGLLTVVCRDADLKPLRQIAADIRSLVGRAREGKVRPDDIEGSTFSISNLGMYDVDHFIAIINPPEAAILAVGSVREVPVVENGEVKAGMRMKATISVDHRVSDGVEAARFLQRLAVYLEEPLRLML